MAADPDPRKILVLVEGQTEETFIKNVLSRHLSSFNIAITPIILRTKRTEAGVTFKGGVSTYQRIEKQLLNLLADSSANLVTTMLDYYGFPTISGIPRAATGSASAKAESMERSIEQAIGSTHQGSPARFRAYLSLHEFEALLFSQVSSIAAALGTHLSNELENIVRQYQPEEIDDHVATCPSARLKALFPDYKKRVDGPTIANAIGLEIIRRNCPHFDRWLTFLETP